MIGPSEAKDRQESAAERLGASIASSETLLVSPDARVRLVAVEQGMGAAVRGNILVMTARPAAEIEDLESIVDQVVEAVRPLRVVLFGSRARGEARAASDFDLLVEMPDGTDRLKILKQLYLLGIPSVEFVVTTPTIFSKHKDDANYVHYDVARDGRELYAA